MTRIESSIVVPKSVQQSFAFLDQLESHLQFIPRLTDLQLTSPAPFGRPGGTAHGVLNYFGIRIPVDYEIIEHQPNERLAMRGKMGPVDFKDGYMLTPVPDGTRLTFWLELTPTGLARLFQPFAGLIGKVHAWETLTKLKRVLEKWNPSAAEQVGSSR